MAPHSKYHYKIFCKSISRPDVYLTLVGINPSEWESWRSQIVVISKGCPNCTKSSLLWNMFYLWVILLLANWPNWTFFKQLHIFITELNTLKCQPVLIWASFKSVSAFSSEKACLHSPLQFAVHCLGAWLDACTWRWSCARGCVGSISGAWLDTWSQICVVRSQSEEEGWRCWWLNSASEDELKFKKNKKKQFKFDIKI